MEDLAALSNFFIAQYSKRCGRRVVGISAEARSAMQHYEWPGNIRELENAIERAVVLGSEPEIQVNDLPETIWETAAEEPAAAGNLSYPAHPAETPTVFE